MSNAANAALTGPWKDLWNGDLSVTDTIIAEDFTVHAASLTGTGPDEIHGRDALNAWCLPERDLCPGLTGTFPPTFPQEPGTAHAADTQQGRWPGGSIISAEPPGRTHSKDTTTMQQQTGPVLVTGATGNTGRSVLDALIGRGAPVRTMVRTAADRSRLPDGVPAAVADFDNAACLAVRAGVRHLVVFSQPAAEEQSLVRLLRYRAAVERHIRDLGIAWTFLRPKPVLPGAAGLRPADWGPGPVLRADR